MMSTCATPRLLRDQLRGRQGEAEPGPAVAGRRPPRCAGRGPRRTSWRWTARGPRRRRWSRRASRPKISSRCSGLTPGPWSATNTATAPGGRGAAPMVIGVPFGACRIAFSSRFVSTREISVTSTSTGGRASGRSSRTGCRCSAGPRSPSTRSTSSGSERRGAAGLQHAGLDPAHVEQVLHQVGQPVGLLVDERRQALAGLRVEVDLGVGQRRRGRLDPRQRRPEVMGDGGDERLGEPCHLLGQPGPQDLLAQLGALDGQRDLVGEQAERLALGPGRRVGRQHQQPDRPPGGGQGMDQDVAAHIGMSAEPRELSRRRQHPVDLVVG